MKDVSYHDQIAYLVKRKFGNVSRAPNPLTSLSSKYDTHPRLYTAPSGSDVDEYKAVLHAQSPGEIQALYEEEKTKELDSYNLKLKLEEEQRFFNQPLANADFVHWSKAAHWTLDEAIALSFGKAPEIVNWKSVEPFTKVSPFAINYARRRDLALRAIPWKKLYDPVLPSIFLGWAKEVEIDVPAALIAEAERRGDTAINWRERYTELQQKYIEDISHATALMNEALKDKEPEPHMEAVYSTPLIELANKAAKNFFEPRQSLDAKKPVVVEWLMNEGRQFTPPLSENLATAIFTIIKPSDHNPRKRK